MSLESWAGGLKRQTLMVYYAARDPRLPWAVRLIALMVAAYALSPIDLIPDFIPVLGLIDDLILVPLGIALVIRLTPPEVIAHARERAGASGRPVSRVAAGCVIVVWLLLAAALLAWVLSG